MEHRENKPKIRAHKSFVAYRVVQELVRDGKLRIIHIDAPPRTISSAFQVSLTEGADGHMYEPFRKYGGEHPLDEVCREILRLYDEIKEKRTFPVSRSDQPAEADKPVVLTVKELSQFMKDKDLKYWLPLIGGWVSIIRSPNVQIKSFMARSVLNGNAFTPQQIEETRSALVTTLSREPSEYDMVYALSERFREQPRKNTPPGIILPHKLELKEFDMWGALYRHYQELKKYDIPKVIVDGTVLCTDPEGVMKQVAKELKLPFSDGMVNGWSKAGGGNLIPDLSYKDLKADAWVDDVIKSRSFSPPKNQPLPLSKFTPSVRKYTEKALEYFVDFANSPHAILPRTPKDIDELLSKKVLEGAFFGMEHAPGKKPSFSEAQPITTYSVILSMPVTNDLEKVYKQEMLAKLETEHKENFADSFQIMRNRQQQIDSIEPGQTEHTRTISPTTIAPGSENVDRRGQSGIG